MKAIKLITKRLKHNPINKIKPTNISLGPQKNPMIERKNRIAVINDNVLNSSYFMPITKFNQRLTKNSNIQNNINIKYSFFNTVQRLFFSKYGL